MKEIRKAAIKAREPVLSDIEPTSNDGGQAQKMDAQHSEIEQLKAERDALKAQRQPLTDAEIEELERWVEFKETGKPERIALTLLVRRVEAAHGIGGDA